MDIAFYGLFSIWAVLVCWHNWKTFLFMHGTHPLGQNTNRYWPMAFDWDHLRTTVATVEVLKLLCLDCARTITVIVDLTCQENKRMISYIKVSDTWFWNPLWGVCIYKQIKVLETEVSHVGSLIDWLRLCTSCLSERKKYVHLPKAANCSWHY